MAAICPHFKWIGFHISDLIQNLEHLQTNLFWPFKIQTSLNFWSPLYKQDLNNLTYRIVGDQKSVWRS